MNNDLRKRRGSGGGGGGGGARGGGSSGASRGSSAGGSRTGSPGFSGSRPGGSGGPPITAGGSSRAISPTSRGGGPSVQIPAGQSFAGRSEGGGTRSQVYGTRQYGSGYPGISGRGVSGRGFPFYFWPVTWGGVLGISAALYLDSSSEYGSTDNSTRPGGAEYTAVFTSSSNTTNTSTFRILSDQTTIQSLVTDITTNCSSWFSSSSSSSLSDISSYPPNGPPLPEQSIQYYRASSVVLTLDGYNNTAVFTTSTHNTASNVPLPQNVDTSLMNCLNLTIGSSVPLVDADANTSTGTPGTGQTFSAATRSEGNWCGTVFLVWWTLRVLGCI